jgi:hypothetical protein
MRMCWVVIACIACSKSSDKPKEGSPSAAAPAGNADLIARAGKITDGCPLIAKEFVDKLVPDGAPKPERFPPGCAIYGKQSGLVVSFGPYPEVAGEAITGLGTRAFLQRLDPHSKGAVYLIVILGDNGSGPFGFSVTVAGPGEDYKDDAVAIAKDIIKRI